MKVAWSGTSQLEASMIRQNHCTKSVRSSAAKSGLLCQSFVQQTLLIKQKANQINFFQWVLFAHLRNEGRFEEHKVFTEKVSGRLWREIAEIASVCSTQKERRLYLKVKKFGAEDFRLPGLFALTIGRARKATYRRTLLISATLPVSYKLPSASSKLLVWTSEPMNDARSSSGLPII